MLRKHAREDSELSIGEDPFAAVIAAGRQSKAMKGNADSSPASSSSSAVSLAGASSSQQPQVEDEKENDSFLYKASPVECCAVDSAAGDPLQLYLLYSKPALEIVTKPFLVGPALEAAAKAASADFVQFLHQQFPKMRQPVAALNILRGGSFYALDQAWRRVMGDQPPLPVGEILAHRAQDGAAWSCVIQPPDIYSCRVLREASTILIGDTVATGSTLARVIDYLIEMRKSDVQPATSPLDVHIFTVAGGHFARTRLSATAAKLRAELGGTLYITFANAIFHLADNGTDLGFVEARCIDSAQKGFDRILGDFKQHMRCAVWDWGDRFLFPLAHLAEVFHHFASIANTPEWIMRGISDAKQSCQARLSSNGQSPDTTSTVA